MTRCAMAVWLAVVALGASFAPAAADSSLPAAVNSRSDVASGDARADAAVTRRAAQRALERRRAAKRRCGTRRHSRRNRASAVPRRARCKRPVRRRSPRPTTPAPDPPAPPAPLPGQEPPVPQSLPGSGETTDQPAPPARLERLQALTLEFEIRLSRTTVPAGDLRVEFNNSLAEDPHNLYLRREDGSGRTFQFETLGPGEISTQTVKVSPGSYRMWCSLSGHETLGMRAQLTVTDG